MVPMTKQNTWSRKRNVLLAQNIFTKKQEKKCVTSPKYIYQGTGKECVTSPKYIYQGAGKGVRY